MAFWFWDGGPIRRAWNIGFAYVGCAYIPNSYLVLFCSYLEDWCSVLSCTLSVAIVLFMANFPVRVCQMFGFKLILNLRLVAC